ncbi:Mucosal addressin cell adhesion molecule 1 [Varanus komodoensis]|nr:Mucosal addressin cell adhesion molecule 1 [Varanus komodoensis]
MGRTGQRRGIVLASKSASRQSCAHLANDPKPRRMAVIYLAAWLPHLVWPCSGSPRVLLTVHPREPLVELGGSIQLACAMDCPNGKLQWLGLDTDLGNVVSNQTHSILTVANVTIPMAGTKRCSGQCRREHSLAKVDLRVYSFPDTLRLDSEPRRAVAGQPAHLNCSMSRVYPVDDVTLQWFRGAEPLDSSMQFEEEEEQLFVIQSILEVPEVTAGEDYKCSVTLQLGERRLEREAAISAHTPATDAGTFERVGSSRPATSPPPPTSSQTGSFAASTDGPSPLLPTGAATTTEAPMGTDGSSRTSPPAEKPTSEEQATSPRPTSTLPPTVQTSAKPAVSSQCPPPGDQTLDTMRPCQPEIILTPRQGKVGESFRITCFTKGCSAHVKIRWVEMPLAQTQYRLEEDTGWSALVVKRASVEHQGVYRCVTVARDPQMATLKVVVSRGEWAGPPCETQTQSEAEGASWAI